MKQRICVRFAGDNDFGMTFQPIMLTLHQMIIFYSGHASFDKIQQLPEWIHDKEKVSALVNRLVPEFYLLYSDDFRTNMGKGELVTEYLSSVKPKDIYFDEEIDEFLASGQSNHDGYVLDLRTPEKQLKNGFLSYSYPAAVYTI